MNFDLSEDQGMIHDSISRFVADNYELSQRNAVVAQPHGYSTEHWQQFAELGWLSIPFAEEHGGFGGGAVDTMVIMQAFGKGLVAEPFLPTVLLFGGLLQSGASADVQGDLIPKIIGGEMQGAFGYLERHSRYEITDIATKAAQQDGKWVLDGEKTVVLNGGAAEKIIIAARSSGKQFDASGISLFLVDAAAKGVERTSYRMTDGRDAANIKLSGVVAEAVIGEIDHGYALMERVIDNARLAICAEALGCMESLNAQTLEYLKTRKQFGTTIGSFQALQHRAVDCFAACENTKSLLYRAVCAADANDLDAPRSLLALKVMVGRAGRLIGNEAIQMHGGMGMTDELAVGHYVKRLMIINTLFGDADYHQQKFVALVNAPATAQAASNFEAA
ncbi:MAG: pimeloyl-CoA dehydrogenase small subunit [Pseudomonadales bacterium]|nr:pimeloyl-CoA dehydrogenase small subunit [Pseudomonadales bacterium]